LDECKIRIIAPPVSHQVFDRDLLGTQTLSLCRPAELNSAESICSGQNVRWPHRQHACVPQPARRSLAEKGQ
jgi:hypothetical protein